MGRGTLIRALWAAGMLVWYFVFLRRARLPRNLAAEVAVAAMVAGYCGSRLGGNGYQYESTGAFIGALLGGLLWMLVRKRLSDGLEILESASFALPFAWMPVRLGCVVERGHAGALSDSWLALPYPGGSRWDLALLELLWAVAMSGTFLFLRERRRWFAPLLAGSLGLFRLAVAG